MRGIKHYLRGLLALPALADEAAQRAAFRQAMATLAEAIQDTRGVPLEGFDPAELLSGVHAAMARGLLDDLDFLSPPNAACALYGLASALPDGPERRELGRRVLLRLNEGDARTFVSLATAVALGSSRAFEGPGMHARVSLALHLPIGVDVPVDGLALALISRRELAQQWLVVPATGSLAARRMAARLLERAAREAARRAVQGDDGALWLFDAPAVQTAWTHLMGDREPLVWRHVATGRGLLSAVLPRFAEEVERDLSPSASVARARRGAASLAARVAIRPGEAVDRARELLLGPLGTRDPGLSAALLYGLPRAAEVEPEAAEVLLDLAVERGGMLAADALLDLRREWHGRDFGRAAADKARTLLRQRYGHALEDEGDQALLDLLCEELGEREHPAASLLSAVYRALDAFAERGARAAHELSREALDLAEAAVVGLENLPEDDADARHASFRLLHELDVALLESSTLSDLLALQSAPHEPSPSLGPVLSRLSAYVLRSEGVAYAGGEGVPHLTLRMRRLRTLLHLLDADSVYQDPAQRLETVRLLLVRVRHDAPSAMDRIVHAAIARGADGLVRDEQFELSDVVLGTAQHVPTPEGFATLSEGSMLPEVKACTRALAQLVKAFHRTRGDASGHHAVLEGLNELSRALPTDSSPRTEGLRGSLLRLARALSLLGEAPTLRALGNELRPLELLEQAVDEIAELALGARRRLGGERLPETAPTSGHGVWALGLALERTLDDGNLAGFTTAFEALADSLREELPPIFADLTTRTVRALLSLPREGERESLLLRHVERARERPLPAWLPRGRVLGDFYVLRALGSAAGGSVFVAKRVAERADPAAPELALKVPEYDGGAARFLSETQFMALFRHEAGAMFAVPPHENLATFVAFDGDARPRPLLVMELVRGPSLGRVLAKGDMDMAEALRVLRGVIAGLSCMHAVGVGHLGVRPENVILREHGPVLVDYGLSGRHVRPGCGSGRYAAPEVVEPLRPDDKPLAPPADVYALGCLAFELLTGRPLFDADSDVALARLHRAHDGRPSRLNTLEGDSRLAPLVEWLSGCLRHDPAARPAVDQLARDVAPVCVLLASRGWPLSLAAEDEETALTPARRFVYT